MWTHRQPPAGVFQPSHGPSSTWTIQRRFASAEPGRCRCAERTKLLTVDTPSRSSRSARHLRAPRARTEDLNKELFCGSSLSTLRAKAKKRLARDPRRSYRYRYRWCGGAVATSMHLQGFSSRSKPEWMEDKASRCVHPSCDRHRPLATDFLGKLGRIADCAVSLPN